MGPIGAISKNGGNMIDALITGRLAGTPTKRQTKTGEPFAGARVRCQMHDGSYVVVSASAFDVEPMAALLVMQEGEAVALTGPLTLTTWTDNDGNLRPSASLVVVHVLTAYNAQKKKKAQPAAMPVPSPGQVRIDFD